MSSLANFLIFAKTHEEKVAVARRMVGLDNYEFPDEAIDNMKIGVEYEDLIRQTYSKSVGMKVYEAGFCIYRDNPIFGGSPDGIFQNRDILEIKITSKDTPQISFSNYDEIPKYYQWQMLGNMFIMDSERCHYAAYSRESGNIYSRIFPYNHSQWMNEVYIPACIFHKEYIMPLLIEYNLPTPYETYIDMIEKRIPIIKEDNKEYSFIDEDDSYRDSQTKN